MMCRRYSRRSHLLWAPHMAVLPSTDFFPPGPILMLQTLCPKDRPIKAAVMSPMTKKRIDVMAITGAKTWMAKVQPREK